MSHFNLYIDYRLKLHRVQWKVGLLDNFYKTVNNMNVSLLV